MGERYLRSCPNCGDEMYFGNWSNYVSRCMKCGKYFIITHGIKEISHKEAIEISENEKI
jgi:DNA-directed RNA polymerase subunit M/transcription elongation factor TFIIS